MKSKLSHIFLRPSLKRAVEELHERIRREHRDVAQKCGYTTLHEFLAVPDCFDPAKYQLYNPAAFKATVAPEFPGWSPRQAAMLEARWRFIQVITHAGLDAVLHNPEPRWQELEEISWFSISMTTVLAIKCFWLHLGYDVRGPNRKDVPYLGKLPDTESVRRAYKTLFGTTFSKLARGSVFTHQLAEELGVDGLWLNSALSVIGDGIVS